MGTDAIKSKKAACSFYSFQKNALKVTLFCNILRCIYALLS